MLKIKRDTNQQDFKIVDLYFVKSKKNSLTLSCGSRFLTSNYFLTASPDYIRLYYIYFYNIFTGITES